MPTKTEIQTLMQRGFAALKEGNYQKSLEVGRRLRKRRHSSAFEIMALAYLKLRRAPKAISTLEEGVRKAPQIWLLWELLGNTYSSVGRSDDAERAYQSALAIEGCNRNVVHLNRAIAFNRAGSFDKAEAAFRAVRSAYFKRRVLAGQIRIALAKGRTVQARTLAVTLSRCRPNRFYDLRNEAEVAVACALGLKTSAALKRKSVNFARKAIDCDPNNHEALQVVRELQHPWEADLKCYRLLVAGVMEEESENSKKKFGFFRSVDVAAKDEPAAFREVALFFAKGVREGLRLEEAKILKKSFRGLPGVYRLTEVFLYPRRAR